MLYSVLRSLVVVAARLFFRLKARGHSHVPRTGPVLLVANHSSVLDPPLVGAATTRHLSYLAKAELFRIPLFGGLIRRLGARPLRRDGADAGALRTALRVLEKGGALLVFPEGTRGTEGMLRPAKGGVGMLAVLSGAPVIPVYVSGSGRAWPKGRKFPRPTAIRVTFGPPLRFPGGEGSGRRQDYEAASREMMAAIALLKDGTGPSELDAGSAVRGGREVGGAGFGGIGPSPQFTDGRSEQHGEA